MFSAAGAAEGTAVRRRVAAAGAAVDIGDTVGAAAAETGPGAPAAVDIGGTAVEAGIGVWAAPLDFGWRKGLCARRSEPRPYRGYFRRCQTPRSKSHSPPG